ncbi:MAG: transcriptional repressor [Acutalibacteraceae bacterium]|nr:transcriptional repressor [Acutalibacteraceae bacterium]
MKNYSRQREAILNVLCSTKTHPTAAWIYENVRIEIPNISLGTVYRNLGNLEKEGVIRKIPVGDNHEHFDGDISQHSHFYCKSCETITDIFIDTEDTRRLVEADTGSKVDFGTYTFVGVCKNCLSGK